MPQPEQQPAQLLLLPEALPLLLANALQLLLQWAHHHQQQQQQHQVWDPWVG
jgi:hypothetical protein